MKSKPSKFVKALFFINGRAVIAKLERASLGADWQEITFPGVRGKVWQLVNDGSTQPQPHELTGKESLKALRRSVFCFCDSYQRLPAVLHFGRDPKNPLKWFRLLGGAWETFDNVGRHKDIILERLQDATRAQLDAMMSKAERAAWAVLPEEITAFRGCSQINLDGMSFSLDRDIAAKFPYLQRYPAEGPILVEARIQKRFSVLKLGRGEREIISAKAGAAVVVSVTPLPTAIPQGST